MTTGTLLSNLVPVTLNDKVKVYRTGIDFGGAFGRRLRLSLVEGLKAKLLKPSTQQYPPAKAGTRAEEGEER